MNFTPSFLAIVPVLFLVYLCLNMPIETALATWAGPWLNVFDPRIQSLNFYKWMRGTDYLGKNLVSMGFYTGVLSMVFIFLMLLDRFFARHYATKRWLIPALYVTFAGTFYVAEQHIAWFELLRPLPLIVFIFGIHQLIKALQTRGDPQWNPKGLFLISFSAFAFILLFKMLFNVHVFHYGFALAFPAAVLLVFIVTHEIPAHATALPRFLGTGRFYKHAVAFLIVIFIAKHVALSTSLYQLKNYPVGAGRDQLMDYYPFLNPRGEIVSQTLAYMEKEWPPEIQFAAIPHGSMINYLSRRANPVPILKYNAVEALLIPENIYLKKLKENAPPYILFLELDTSLFGARYFGQDYALTVYQWIVQNYSLEKQFGEVPFTGKGFGIQILKRLDGSKPTTDD